MTDLEPRRFRLYALLAVLGAAFVWTGYATFDQWAAFLSGLLVGA